MNKALELEQRGEPPSKKARRVSEENGSAQSVGESAQKRRSSRRNKDTESVANANGRPARGSSTKGWTPVQNEQEEEQDEAQAPSDVESEMERNLMGEGNDDTVASVNGDADGYAAYRILGYDGLLTRLVTNPPRHKCLRSKTSLSRKRD